MQCRRCDQESRLLHGLDASPVEVEIDQATGELTVSGHVSFLCEHCDDRVRSCRILHSQKCPKFSPARQAVAGAVSEASRGLLTRAWLDRNLDVQYVKGGAVCNAHYNPRKRKAFLKVITSVVRVIQFPDPDDPGQDRVVQEDHEVEVDVEAGLVEFTVG
jgi:hypothetical protein